MPKVSCARAWAEWERAAERARNAVSRTCLSYPICLLLLHGQANGGGLLQRAAGSGDGDRIGLRDGTKIASATSAKSQHRKDGQRCQTQEYPSMTGSAEHAAACGESQQRDTGKQGEQAHPVLRRG